MQMFNMQGCEWEFKKRAKIVLKNKWHILGIQKNKQKS